jgi:triacylglycerol lipase
MLARLQQFIVFLLLAASVSWAAFFLIHGSIAGAAGGLTLIGASYAIAIGFEFYLLRRSYAARSADRPTFAQLATAWWVEVVAASQVFLWRQPFRSKAISDSLPTAKPTCRGVLLVHGFVCNRGLWNPWMKSLLKAQVPFVALTLEPVFGSIDAYVVQIEEAVRRLETATGVAPVLVAHSMGGLAVRAWLSRMGGTGRFHRVVTIATPHRGTAMAHHAHTTNGRQMRIGSAWLDALTRAEAPAAHQAFTCFWSHCDNIVFPTDSATLPGADNRQLEATPHVRMVYHPKVLVEVLRLVKSEP